LKYTQLLFIFIFIFNSKISNKYIIIVNNNIKIIEQNGAPKVAQKLREIRDSRNGEENKNIDTKEMLNSIDLEV
jgi:hypothetical protein